MPEIDLSQYVGKEVILTLDNEETLSGELKFLKNHNAYCYEVKGWQFTKTWEGLSKPQIISIQLKNPMTGIAQQHPNINLKDFEGQRCYVKWNDGVEGVGCVKSTTSNGWDIPGNSNRFFGKDGVHQNKALYVTEIYGEGAYEIITKDTFDAPNDDLVTKATEALKDLTEEQIAKVLHALKGK
jgi:small nuclear ribonucleoprotein (snRNP)-like protein